LKSEPLQKSSFAKYKSRGGFFRFYEGVAVLISSQIYGILRKNGGTAS